MTCDGTASYALTAGDDWVWSWSTAVDVSGWSDPVVTFTTTDGTVFASSEDGTVDVDLDAGAGEFVWRVEDAVTADAPPVVLMAVKVLIDGDETTVGPGEDGEPVTYRVRRNRTERGEGS